jgi:hypothetical protein
LLAAALFSESFVKDAVFQLDDFFQRERRSVSSYDFHRDLVKPVLAKTQGEASIELKFNI